MITATARGWFGSDADYPGSWEPDGADFLSPALCEAVLMAETLPTDDPRVPPMYAAAERHAEPELDKASGTDYMIEHWLACYAVLYLT